MLEEEKNITHFCTVYENWTIIRWILSSENSLNQSQFCNNHEFSACKTEKGRPVSNCNGCIFQRWITMQKKKKEAKNTLCLIFSCMRGDDDVQLGISQS